MAIQITNVSIDSVNYDASRAAISWQVGQHRFHLWFRPEERTQKGAFLGDGTVYKNPIADGAPTRRSPTIKMAASSGPNMLMLEQAWRIVDRDGLLAAAMALHVKEQEDELRAREASILLQRRRSAAEAAYHALVYARNLIGPDAVLDAAIAKADNPVPEED